MTPLGPEGYDKIAILGSAPSSLSLAPYDDKSWAMWGTSPGVFGVAPRTDVWFEIHRFHEAEPGRNTVPTAKPWFSSEYTAFLRNYPGPVFMSRLIPSIPNSIVYPFEAILEKYGRYFFTSSIAWMLALAIESKPKAIGLWGVDMAASEEYSYQRPGCQHFIALAQSMGIEVYLPEESDLMQPPSMYGISEQNPRYIKIRARMDEFQARINTLNAQQQNTNLELHFLQGAMDDAKYMLQTWADDIPFETPQAMSFAREFKPEDVHHVKRFKPGELEIPDVPHGTVKNPSKANGKSKHLDIE